MCCQWHPEKPQAQLCQAVCVTDALLEALFTAALTRHHQATSKEALHSASCPKGGQQRAHPQEEGRQTHGNSAAVCQSGPVCAPDTRMHQPKTATGVLAAASAVYITRKQSNSNGRAPASHTTDCLSSTWTAPPLHAAATTTMPSATPPPRPILYTAGHVTQVAGLVAISKSTLVFEHKHLTAAAVTSNNSTGQPCHLDNAQPAVQNGPRLFHGHTNTEQGWAKIRDVPQKR